MICHVCGTCTVVQPEVVTSGWFHAELSPFALASVRKTQSRSRGIRCVKTALAAPFAAWGFAAERAAEAEASAAPEPAIKKSLRDRIAPLAKPDECCHASLR